MPKDRSSSRGKRRRHHHHHHHHHHRNGHRNVDEEKAQKKKATAEGGNGSIVDDHTMNASLPPPSSSSSSQLSNINRRDSKHPQAEAGEAQQNPSTLKRHQGLKMGDADICEEGDRSLRLLLLKEKKRIQERPDNRRFGHSQDVEGEAHQQGLLPGAVRVQGIVDGNGVTDTGEDQDETSTTLPEDMTESSEYIMTGLDHFRPPDDAPIMAVALEVSSTNEDVEEGQRPFAIKYNPDAKNRPYKKKEQFFLYSSLALVIVASIVIGVSFGVAFCHPKLDGVDPTSLHAPKGIEAPIAEAVGIDALRSSPGSPYVKALDWIISKDPMQLTAESPNLVQRYILAYFWYATSVDGPWRSCNPTDPNTIGILKSTTSSSGNNTTKCLWSVMYNDKRGMQLVTETYEILSHSWLSNITECYWAGIKCDKHNQVIKLDLPGAGLSGSFPEGIYKLPYLQTIIFLLGSMRGPLPGQLVTKMKHLVSIELAYNRFTGSVPEEWWDEGRNLQKIYISGNKITGSIPSKIGKLQSLKFFLSGNNSMTGTLPSEIGLLDSLTWLDLSENDVTGTIPPTIGNWRGLKSLWLNNNWLVGSIPDTVGKLANLEELSLHNNLELSGHLPGSLFNLPRLRGIYLFYCNISGTLSSRIGNLEHSLLHLHISQNKFYGTIPTEITRLTSMYSMWLQGNDFHGAVPTALCSREQHRGKTFLELEDFRADCAPGDGGDSFIQLECDCCSYCCQPHGLNCLETSS